MAMIKCNYCGKMVSSNMPTCPHCKRTVSSPEPSIDIKVVRSDREVSQRTKTTKYIGSIRKKAVLSGIVVVMLLLVRALVVKGYIPVTAKGRILSRARTYVHAYDSLDHVKSYSYLSRATRDRVSFDKWKDHVFKNASSHSSVFSGVIIEPGESRAKVMYNYSDNSFQLWVHDSDNWYRGYYEQVGDKDQELFGKTIPIATAKKPPSFDIKEILYGWDPSKSSANVYSLHPQIKFSVLNNGTDNISKLTFLAVFYEGNRKKIFGKEESYVIGSSDLPLRPGYTSETCFLKSSVGLQANEYNVSAIISRPLRIELYYKLDNQNEWQLYSEYFSK